MNEFFSKGLGKGLLIIVIIFLGIQAAAGLFSLRYIGTGIAAANTISVSGHGEIYAAPDLATFTYSIISDKSTVTAAQDDAAQKGTAVINYLKGAGVSEKDIQTSGYNVYPQYEYQNASCPVSSGGEAVYCPPGKQVLTGYEARESVTVKVRDLTKAGDLLAGVGDKGASEVSSLNFTFDDPNAPQNDARTKAIADAKSKADMLAKQLGVSIVRVTNFSESSDGSYPRPYALEAGMGGAADKSTSAPTIAPGQNQVTDDVNITYEIR